MQIKALDYPTLPEMEKLRKEGWRLGCFTPELAIFEKDD